MSHFMQCLTTAALLVVAAPAWPAETDPFAGDDGARLYQRFCASCHGRHGDGDGPVAPALKVVVPDLTRISRRHGGRFPEARVIEIIDGRAVIPAHGTRYMPVWGYELEARATGDESGRAAAQGMIGRLADHLRGLQQ